MTDDLLLHSTGERIGQIVDSVLIGYRLTIGGGTPVESTRWPRDTTVPRYAVRVSTADDTIVYSPSVWVGHADDVEEHLRAWLLERVHLEGTKRGHGRRPNPWWAEVWRKANPGRS